MSREQFVGTWKLSSCIWTDSAGRLSYPYGHDPQGYLIYTSDGFVAVNFMSANRRRFVSDDPLGGSIEERRAGKKTYQSYCGTFEVGGDCVIHHVEVSLFPNWVGSKQERFYRFSGNQLTLSTHPLLLRGAEHRAELVWERVLQHAPTERDAGETHGQETVSSDHP
ncbi:MAG: lipocalin-like domain-containing protein [Chloroflexota bacterium]|nr:lipocalin-like domain-containing protein [Chloroflexota bacterium]